MVHLNKYRTTCCYGTHKPPAVFPITLSLSLSLFDAHSPPTRLSDVEVFQCVLHTAGNVHTVSSCISSQNQPTLLCWASRNACLRARQFSLTGRGVRTQASQARACCTAHTGTHSLALNTRAVCSAFNRIPRRQQNSFDTRPRSSSTPPSAVCAVRVASVRFKETRAHRRVK